MPPKIKTKPKKRVAVCEANIPVTDCLYRHDLNYLGQMFTDNSDAHKDICDRLDSMQHIKLNGDDKITDFADMMREIYHATISVRKTNKLKEAFKDWMQNTAIGRFFRTRGGHIIAYFLWLWIIISSLNTLGITNIKPVQIIEGIIRYYLKTGG